MMFHATARRLDEPYKLYGFTVPQWLLLLFGGGGLIGGLWALDVGVQIGGFLATLILGTPALYWLLGESGRIEPAELLLDAARRLYEPRVHAPGGGDSRSAVFVAAVNSDARDSEVAEEQAPPW